MHSDNIPLNRSSWRSCLKERIFRFAFQSGLVRVGHGLSANSLTVLNYHRIDDTTSPRFDTFKPNVSANPANFAAQLDYLSSWFNIVSLEEIVQWLDGKISLPPYAALITFDDGYLDNYVSAYPILKKRNLSAVIFLTTGHIQQDIPFYWDLIAYCFHHTHRDFITFPNGKQEHWKNEAEMEMVSRDLIENLKLLGEETKEAWVAQIPSMLDVSIPAGYFQNLMMTWDHIREMRGTGIEFGGHTMRHPILTRVTSQRAGQEIMESKKRIEQEISESILGFAYPNGGKVDFNREIESITANAGYRAAFTLLNGPESLRDIKNNPFAIRRIFISNKHTLPQFSALVSSFNRYRPS